MGGALAIVNPCGFPLLVAHLSLSMRGDAAQRSGRDGLTRGLAVASGFVAALLVVAIPLALGVQHVTRLLPHAGLVVGVALLVAGIAVLSGTSLKVGTRFRPRPLDGSLRSFFALGVAQAITALGCTLPVFLAVIGTTGSSRGAGSAVATVGAYAAGAASMLVVLSAGAVSAGRLLTTRIRGAARYVHVAGGVFLVLSGSYLTYFWWRLTSPSSAGADPVVTRVQAFSAWLYRYAHSGDAGMTSAALVVGLAVVAVSVLWRRRPGTEANSIYKSDI